MPGDDLSRLHFSNTVKFKPWVGENYARSSPRILVLGQSHYGLKTGELEPTRNVILRQFGEGPGVKYERFKFLENVERLMSQRDDEPTIESSRKFWAELAFYNYVQVAVRDGRVPKEQNYRSAYRAFCEVVCSLKPDIVFVAGGKVLWDRLPDDGKDGWERKSRRSVKTTEESKELDVFSAEVTFENRRAKFATFYVNHPSRCFQASVWRPWFHAGIEEIRKLSAGLINA